MKRSRRAEHRALLCGASLLTLFAFGCASAPEPVSAVRDEPPFASQTAEDSNRRIFESCNRAAAAARQEGRVGEGVFVTWAWKEMRDVTANVEVPATILRIDSPWVVITFDPSVANLQLYTSVWLYSGHIQANSDGSFDVDPCSATFEKGKW